MKIPGKASIIRARTSQQFDSARELIRAYEHELGVDLCFQGFEEELAQLPEKYSPPEGSLLLAMSGGRAVGCVALRPTDAPEICEMKRLYVDPESRGAGIGRELARAILNEGRRLGYRRMILDTLQRLTAALTLYRHLGFEEIEPYYHNPLENVVFLGLDL